MGFRRKAYINSVSEIRLLGFNQNEAAFQVPSYEKQIANHLLLRYDCKDYFRCTFLRRVTVQ